MERLQVRTLAGAAGELSPPESTLCADSYSVFFFSNKTCFNPEEEREEQKIEAEEGHVYMQYVRGCVCVCVLITIIIITVLAMDNCITC